MSSERWFTCHWGQDGYGLLKTNYLVPCWSNPAHHWRLSGRDTGIVGEGQNMIARTVSPDLEKAGGSHPASHCSETMESTSASGDQHAQCWEDLPLYDCNILLFLITLSFSLLLSMQLLPTYCCQSHALHSLQQGPARLFKIRQPLFSVHRSHLSAQSFHVCLAAPTLTKNTHIYIYIRTDLRCSFFVFFVSISCI